MERFCHKCGSLVSGSGTFCPLCGESMEVEGTAMASTGSVDLSKPVSPSFTANGDVLPNGDGTMGMATPQQQMHTAGGMGYANTAPSTPASGYQQPAGYSQPAPNAAQYPQGAPIVYNNYSAPAQKTMTTGQWVLTTFLLSLGSIVPFLSLILLLVWAFGGTEYVDKKNYARASLIWMLIGIGVVILLIIIMAVLGVSMASIMADSF